jgi:hypothetical protein
MQRTNMKVDWSKSQAWVDSYVSNLMDPNQIPGRLGRTWMECEAQRVGLVNDFRGWKLGESHAAWYAALIRTGMLHKVNRLEKKILRIRRGSRTTLITVRALLNGRLHDTVTAHFLRAMLEQPAP